MTEISYRDEQILNNIYGGADLRQQAKNAEILQNQGLIQPVPTDWKKVREDIRIASNPPATDMDKLGATGVLGAITSYADESAAAAGAVIATTAANYFFPDYLTTENSQYFFNSMIALQGYWFVSGCFPMVETWKDLKSTGICTSPTAKLTYDAMSKITSNEILKKIAFGTGYWALNMAKEIPWWAAGGFTAAISGMNYDVDPVSSLSVFLGGACVGSSLYQATQYAIQRVNRARRERVTDAV